MSDKNFLQSKLSVIIGLIGILALVFVAFIIVSAYDAGKNTPQKESMAKATSLPETTAIKGSNKTDDTDTKEESTKTVAPTLDNSNATVSPATKVPTKAPATKEVALQPTMVPATKVPTKIPTKAPIKTPTKAPTKAPATPKPTVKPVKGETLGVSNTEINQYYSESVFIGDSVMYGFQLYCMRQPAGYLGGPDFLAAGSFSARWAILPVSSKSVHPKYQGVKRTIWDSLSIIKPKRVFFFFGLNDLGSGVDTAYNNYMKVINKLKKDFPNIEINFVSTTPMYKGSEKRGLNNKNIDALNNRLKAYCEKNNAYFFDVASYLKDGDGCLAKQFCSDRYVHQTNAAYKVWEVRLKEYAALRITEMKEKEAAKATKAPSKTTPPKTKAPSNPPTPTSKAPDKTVVPNTKIPTKTDAPKTESTEGDEPKSTQSPAPIATTTPKPENQVA